MRISVVIPALNEADRIGGLIRYLRGCAGPAGEIEIIVIDGNSIDGTAAAAQNAGASVFSSPRGRAVQMNTGAVHATGDILFFLHADTVPPPTFLTDIVEADCEGYSAGCYRLSFDQKHWFLQMNCWFTRFNVTRFRFGDQGLFVRREIFRQCGGFDEKHLLLEDQEIVHRIRQIARFRVLRGAVKTSARKYLQNGIIRLQLIFVLIYFLHAIGFTQETLMKIYSKLIHDVPVKQIGSLKHRVSADRTS